MGELSHFDAAGASRMVDVGDKPVSRRSARASGRVVMDAKTLAMIGSRRGAKGDVLEVARLAGIMAAKRTADLIPLCHPLAIESVAVDFTSPDDRTLAIEACVEVEAKTGVEMEALTVVSVAALTVYDMCKSVDRGMTIEQIRLEEKSGGRSGTWQRTMTSDG
jgi:cyclic pyranopterin monophosphate synthase